MSTEDHERFFDSVEYIRRYYGGVSDENRGLLEFFHEVYACPEISGAMLELGGGPTLYQLISASGAVRSMVFSDYLPDNRAAVNHWLDGASDAHSWRAFVEYVLMLENAPVDAQRVAEREAHLRERIEAVIPCDIRRDDPLSDTDHRGDTFDVVSMLFVLEAVDCSKEACFAYLRNVDRLVKPGGHLVIGTIIGTSAYTVAGNSLHTAFVSVVDVLVWLQRLNYRVRLDRKIASDGGGDYASLSCIWATKD